MQKIDKIQLTNIIENAPFVIIDKKVKDLFFKDSLAHAYTIEQPEESKSIQEYEKALSFFLERKIRRDSKLLVIGGGATSDLGGFVASTILRGIAWDVIPTTLLAMIDASIGGKVGVNSNLGKNLIGSFHSASNIYFYFDFLKTLDQREVDSGKGELLKYLYLNDSLKNELGSFDEVIISCAKFKESIVKKDFKESGLRKILNFGHTFGHSFEVHSNLSHGQAVAQGIYFLLTIFSPEKIAAFHQYLEKIELSLEIVKVDKLNFLNTLEFDKKNKDNMISFIINKEEFFISPKELKEKIEASDEAIHFFK